MTEQDNQYIAANLTDIVHRRLQLHTPEEGVVLARLARQMGTYYDLSFRRQSVRLKDLYQYLNPGIPHGKLQVSDAQRAEFKTEFFDRMSELLGAANYLELSMEDVKQAMEEQALFDLSISVNLDDYDRLLVFRRGAEMKTMTLKRWFGRFGERTVEFINYDRVALVFTQNTPGSDVHLKLFQNVPKHDIEILLPEPQVRMRLRDKLTIGVPAVVGGAAVLLTKLGPTLLLIGSLLAFWLGYSDKEVAIDQGVLLALGVGLFALGGHFWRQLGALKNRRLEFLKVLTENLYFKSLDNNSGAIQQLLDTAADEEVKEVFLVYSFLKIDVIVTAAQLDEEIESWFMQSFGCATNFDVADGVAKAVQIGVRHKHEMGYTAVESVAALAALNGALHALVFPEPVEE